MYTDWKITHHHSSVQPAGPDMNKLARENFGKWNAALQTKDAKAVADLYSSSLSFLPTVKRDLVYRQKRPTNTRLVQPLVPAHGF
jgi:hypothetical protein